MKNFKIYNEDCLKALKKLKDNSVDSIVTDPPYGLKFMGKKWDHEVPSVAIWKECLRVLKPGGHLLAFAGTRTQHRMAVNIEDAGFEIRDMMAWVYGSGFAKGLNVAKGIESHEKTGSSSPTAQRKTAMRDSYKKTELAGTPGYGKTGNFSNKKTRDEEIVLNSEKSKIWDGWNTSLKPALEPITLARKPISEKTIVENVLKYETGALNIDGCRVGDEHLKENKRQITDGNIGTFKTSSVGVTPERFGRFPSNLLLDDDQEVQEFFGDNSRFFYCAKASKKDRNEGLETSTKKSVGDKGNGLGRVCEFCGVSQLKASECKCETKSWIQKDALNHHPTVKPNELMRYLCRLITPPGGTVLDPFMGSGSTGKAAMMEGFDFIGCDLDAEYCEISRKRIEAAKNSTLDL